MKQSSVVANMCFSFGLSAYLFYALRQLNLLFSLPVSMRITRDGASELQLSSVAKGI